MEKTTVKELLEAGVHFGHLTRKWDPNMAPYIYMERNGIHIINLYKTQAKIKETGEALQKIAASGKKILFVATKKQAKDIVAEKAGNVNMPYITERWPGGMLTNFVTIRKAVKKMAMIDRMKKDGTFNSLSKKERLQVDRQRAKLEKNLGSISDMTRLPGALFVVDIKREHIAIAEAQKLNIPIFAMVDTNSDPREVDYLIPSNDDASKSIEKIMSVVTSAVADGLAERKSEKTEKDAKDEKSTGDKKDKKELTPEEKAEKKAKKAEKAEKADDVEKAEGKEAKAEKKEAKAGNSETIVESTAAKAENSEAKVEKTEAKTEKVEAKDEKTEVKTEKKAGTDVAANEEE
jgi:small subunit ribosomal protein S2